MKQFTFKSLVLSLCLLLTLPACSSPQATEHKIPMGRYVEEAHPLPQELTSLLSLDITAQGRLLLVGSNNKQELSAWLSADHGKTWTAYEPEWLSPLRGLDIYAFSLDEKGNPWLTHREPEATEESSAGTSIQEREPPNPLLYYKEGVFHSFSGVLQNEEGNNAQSISVSGEYLAASYGDIAVYDTATTHELLYAETSTYLQEGDYAIQEATLAVADGSLLRLYDLAAGRHIGELPLHGDFIQQQKAGFFDFNTRRTVVSSTDDKDVFAYCNSSGIYRVSTDGLIHERVLSGELCSLIMPAVSVQQLWSVGDDYYVLITDKESVPWQLSGATLLRYHYDESVPTIPSVQLRIYGLRDSPTLRQASGIFQRQHPEVQIQFDIALSDTDNATALQDAYRGLSTELLADAGPDIILLDGLPIQSYQQQGVLLDLSDMLPSELQANLLPSLLSAYRHNNVVDAIPLRFTAPHLLADEAIWTDLTDVRSLTDAAAALERPQLGILPKDFWDILYPLYSSRWLLEDNSIHMESMEKDLPSLKQLLSLFQGIPDAQLWNAENDARVGAIGVLAGWTPFYYHELTALDQLSGPYTAYIDAGIQYHPFSAEDKAVIIPHAVVGVNAASMQKELAVEFMQCLLSTQVQSLSLGDGLPANRAVLSAPQDNPYSQEFQRFGVSFYDGFDSGSEKSLTIPLYWPEQEYFDQFCQALDSAQVILVDDVLADLIYQEAESYLFGDQSLQQTSASIAQKLLLHLAE